MVIRLYAFVDRPVAVAIDGVHASRLQSLALAGSVAVVGVDSAGQTPTRDEVIAYGRAVEAIAAASDAVLPVRYGETFADEKRLSAALHERRMTVTAALERVRGCSEVDVTVTGSVVDVPTSVLSGAEYLRRRARTEGATAPLHRELTALARETVVRSDPRWLHRAAYLVDKARLDAVVDAVRRIADVHPALNVVCTGPWAPYSFADGGMPA